MSSNSSRYPKGVSYSAVSIVRGITDSGPLTVLAAAEAAFFSKLLNSENISGDAAAVVGLMAAEQARGNVALAVPDDATVVASSVDTANVPEFFESSGDILTQDASALASNYSISVDVLLSLQHVGALSDSGALQFVHADITVGPGGSDVILTSVQLDVSASGGIEAHPSSPPIVQLPHSVDALSGGSAGSLSLAASWVVSGPASATPFAATTASETISPLPNGMVVDPSSGGEFYLINQIAITAAGDAQLLAQADTSLIHLDQFRSDIRFSGINGGGVSVVVIDTGIDLNHSFFGADADHNGIDDRIVFSYDFSGNNDSDASDTNGHGSNVASIVGSQDSTYTGMAPGVNIIALKVFPDGSNPSASSADIKEALDWVVANRAAYNIVSVNMSLGQGDNVNVPTSSFYASEFATLVSNNVVNVVASGNSYYQYQREGVSSPSADPNAWSVGAVWDRNDGGWSYGNGTAFDYTTAPDRIAVFSQRSATMTTIFAPGGDIYGANYDGGVIREFGTSQAAPHIAGLVADMQQLSLQVSGHLMSVVDLRTTMQSSGALIIDGDDENDNVSNTFAAYKRVDAYAWGVAVLNKLFAGTSGDDTLNGTAANDTINGAAGNDRITGGAGNDTIDGGTGSDSAVFSGLRSTYTLTDLGNGSVRVVGPDGTDTVTNIEKLVFSDQTVNLPLNGAPSITSATLTGTVTEIADLATGENVSDRSVTGTISFSDDPADTHTVSSSAKSVSASYPGTFTAQLTDDSTGDGAGTVSWSYTINDSALDKLAAGQTVTQVYTVSVNDNQGGATSRDVTITLTGTNDAPTFSSGSVSGTLQEFVDGSPAENIGASSTAGTINFTDPDLIDSFAASVTPAASGYVGSFNTLFLTHSGSSASMQWTYTVNDSLLDSMAAGETKAQTYTVTINDGHGGSFGQNVTITLLGRNDAPTSSSASLSGSLAELVDNSVGEGTATLSSTGFISFADVDLSDSHTTTVTPLGSGYVGSLTATVTNVSTGDGFGSVT